MIVDSNLFSILVSVFEFHAKCSGMGNQMFSWVILLAVYLIFCKHIRKSTLKTVIANSLSCTP